MQATLSIYIDLLDIGYQESHQGMILQLLSDLKEHSSDEVAIAGGKQYNARILELRAKGYDIVAIRINKCQFNYKLRNRWAV